MLTVRTAVLLYLGAMSGLGAGGVWGQAYPSKPIRILTGGPGSNNDQQSRLVAAGITGPLGQPVVIENRGTTQIVSDAIAKSPPDGYSLMVNGDLIWIGPLLRNEPDPLLTFAPISSLGSAPNVLIVHPSLPVRSVKDLIALAKARPGELNYGTASPGGVDHLSAELLKSMTGAKIEHIFYKSSPPVVAAVATGEIQIMFGGASTTSSLIKAGRVRALAVTSAQPSALYPGMPTMAASGLPGFELVSTNTMWVHAKTPAAVIARLNQEVVRFLKTKEAQEKFLNVGVEVIGNSPEEVVAKLKSRSAIIGKLIKDMGIKYE